MVVIELEPADFGVFQHVVGIFAEVEIEAYREEHGHVWCRPLIVEGGTFDADTLWHVRKIEPRCTGTVARRVEIDTPNVVE